MILLVREERSELFRGEGCRAELASDGPPHRCCSVLLLFTRRGLHEWKDK